MIMQKLFVSTLITMEKNIFLLTYFIFSGRAKVGSISSRICQYYAIVANVTRYSTYTHTPNQSIQQNGEAKCLASCVYAIVVL